MSDSPFRVHDLTPVLNSTSLILFLGLLACIVFVACDQQEGRPNRWAVAEQRVINTPTPTETSRPLSTTLPTERPVSDHPQATSISLPTTTPYPTSTPYPTPRPYFTPVPLPTSVPQKPHPRPKVSGFLLKINGKYVKSEHVSVQVENGHIMVHPMTGEDGSYPTGSKVTLGYYPNNQLAEISWSGVDKVNEKTAVISMDRDREVFASIGP